MSAGHSLLLPFDTDDPMFVRGFEMGRLWAILQANPDDEIEQTVHAVNAEMVIRLAEATARTVVAAPTDDDGWLEATFSAAGEGSTP